eukprot:CAMPEP_0205945110 /NCGR_PEP_ID=MMETSP1325-20131115/65215_1 /ASSEMBLY_ACC=CAM_ASM_000708 /TAXON_ID=236786 /ORGANISM="Florenciella sp., Strain RCC1007" /LENGTH=41 /DNA_ID= /DNA_START= /DNA_END= /DNA_ORIENTATION=
MSALVTLKPFAGITPSRYSQLAESSVHMMRSGFFEPGPPTG